MADIWQRVDTADLSPGEDVGDRTMPRGRVERAVAALFTELLGHERIGVDDNFFALGGHSLLAARLVAMVRKDFHVALTLLELFDNPTVAGIAAFIEGASDAAS
jgi:acyl carrier protein